MSIKLDWQIESEQTHTRATEDPLVRQRRRRAQRRFALLVLVMAGVLALIVALVIWRLRSVDERLRKDLVRTVQAEIAALRVGDFANYMAIQRSASDAFMQAQSRRFQDYQQLKQAGRVQLSGDVVNVAIDGRRGRVVLEEELDGVPYRQVWFYWYYTDSGDGMGGWRHVPDDLTFWGAERTLDLPGGGSVRYRELDEPYAQAIAEALPNWWAELCAALRCDPPPPPQIEIVPQRPFALSWDGDGWTLRVSSPLVERVRADAPLPPNFAQALVEALATRLVRYAAGDDPAPYYTDIAWLRAELGRWAAAQVLGTAGSPFIDSLSATFGPGAPLTLLSALTPTATLESALSAVTGVPMEQLSQDQLNSLAWGDFFQWRLALEPQLLVEGESNAFLALYAQEDNYAASQAAIRLEDRRYALQPPPTVQSVLITHERGRTFATVSAAHYDADGVLLQQQTIYWWLSGGTWRRLG